MYLLEMVLRINHEATYIGHLTQSLTHRNSADSCFHSSSLWASQYLAVTDSKFSTRGFTVHDMLHQPFLHPYLLAQFSWPVSARLVRLNCYPSSCSPAVASASSGQSQVQHRLTAAAQSLRVIRPVGKR